MRLLFEVDTEVYHKDHMHPITRAERARLELIEQVEIISPVLVGYLNDFRVSRTHPGHSRPRVDYSISIHTPFAQGSAVFRDLKGQTGFILPQPRQIVDAFLRRNDEVEAGPGVSLEHWRRQKTVEGPGRRYGSIGKPRCVCKWNRKGLKWKS